MQILRIAIIWMLALCTMSLLVGRLDGFLFAFLLYGMFHTLPALLILALAAYIETVLVQRNRIIAALALGPAFGLLVPAGLYLIAPNKHNAASAMTGLLMITLLTGLLWAASFLLLWRRARQRG